MKTLKRLSLGLVLVAATVTGAAAQETTAQQDTYKFDLGGGIGMSGYLGDANESSLFKHIGVAGNVSFRYLANTRWNIRGLLSVMTLSGNTADWENALPDNANYSFKSTVFDLGGRFEFNFLPYGIGENYKKLRRCTPYLSLGVGATLASCDGNTFIAPNIPMAFGVKYKLRQRLNLSAEFSMTKVFGDKVDGKQLTDLYKIKSSFMKNTDWYSSIVISLSYEFGKRCETCHYVE